MNSEAVSFNRRGIAAIIARILMAALGVLGLGLSACSPDDPYIPTRPSDSVDCSEGAFLRVIHAAPDAPAVDVLIDGVKFFPRPHGYLSFEKSNNNARYYPVGDTARRITFSGNDVSVEASLSLTRDAYYTVYLHGNKKKGYKALVTSDSIFPAAGSALSSRYRIVHLSPDAPDIDVKQDSVNTPRLIQGLSYGSASNYISSKPYFPVGTGMWIYYAGLDSVLRAFTPPYIPLPPNSTFTLVLTGNAQPRGDESFLFFSALQENSGEARICGDSLYGAPPINITFAALRFVNLVASGDSLLDVTIYDPNTEFAANNNFRRNLVDQSRAMENVASLGVPGQPADRRYFYASLISRADFPFRVELHQPDGLGNDRNLGTGVYRRQDVLVGRKELTAQANRRYSIVAYGPYIAGQARSAVLVDNTPPPPSGMAQLRFFHGAFGSPYETTKYKIRVGGMSGNLMGYGEIPAATNSFSVPISAQTIDLLDAQDSVVASMNLRPLEADMSYTVYLSRGPFGDQLYLHALPEDVNRNY